MIPQVSPKDDTGKEDQDMVKSVNVVNPDASDILAGDLEKVSVSEIQKNDPTLKERKLDATPRAKLDEETDGDKKYELVESRSTTDLLDVKEKDGDTKREIMPYDLKGGVDEEEEEEEPIFDGTEAPGMEENKNSDSDTQGSVWPDKAVAISHYVRQKSLGAMSTVLRRFSGKSDDVQDSADEDKSSVKGDIDSSPEAAGEKASQKSGWKSLSFLRRSHDKFEQNYAEENLMGTMKGRIILYTKNRCQDCKMARRYLQDKRLKYVEINIDIFPSRKVELEKIGGSSAVPRLFFNEVMIGGLSEMKILEDSGKIEEKIEYVISETPSYEAPLPPLSGEDDQSDSGAIDELALIVRKMKESISIKDRFYKMRRFSDCFLGSEAVDFLSEDQYLEREDAVEFGRKLVSKLFFQHVSNENIFEDGSHMYRFLDDDPVISRCQNIPRGISDVKPKPIAEISLRLRFLFSAMLEAYTSEDGKSVDYRRIHGCEEFARYLRIVEELQRVDLDEMPREEKLSFFINLYNMMAIHAILVQGHPSGTLDRKKFFGDFKYVIGGSAYSLSAIYNGILRGNQRPPYNLIKPFGAKDKRLKVALPYPEPLIHFALAFGTRSGPALRCYSPGNIDKELIDAACNFLRNGGLHVDLTANVAFATKILKWYSVDFGKNDVEVLKHAANYLDSSYSQALLDLLSNTQMKVVYQNYDWGLNN